MDPATLHALHSILHATNTYSHLQTQLSTCLLRSFPFCQHTSPLLLVTTLLVLSLHIALTHIHTYRHSSPLVSFAPSLSTNTLHHCCYPPHIQRFPALPHHTAYILVSVFVGFSWMVFFHPEDRPCPKIWCIPFISNIICFFFGSEVNVCSEETVVGEFEVRYL